MEETFKEYISSVINLTFGFTPEVRIEVPYAGTIQVFISGSPDERAIVMGKEGKTVAALTRLTNCFARQHSCYVYIYVKPRDTIENNLDETLKLGKFIS